MNSNRAAIPAVSKSAAAAQPMRVLQDRAQDQEAHLKDIDHWKSQAASQATNHTPTGPSAVPQLSQTRATTAHVANKPLNMSQLGSLKPGSHLKPAMTRPAANLVGRLPGEAAVPNKKPAARIAATGKPTARPMMKQPTRRLKPVAPTPGVRAPPSRVAGGIPAPHKVTAADCSEYFDEHYHVLSPWVFVLIFGLILLAAGLGYLYYKFSWQPKRLAAAATAVPAAPAAIAAEPTVATTGAEAAVTGGMDNSARAKFWQNIVKRENARME